MEVILSENVPSLGKAGDVIKVKEGYARNFLIPKKKAYVASAANLKKIELQKQKQVQESAAQKGEAESLAERLGKVSCTVNVEVNDHEKLYGAISETDVANALEVEGFTIDKKSVKFEKPIEEPGIFEVGINLHPEVTAKIRLWVTKK